jgi:hypothetical protein
MYPENPELDETSELEKPWKLSEKSLSSPVASPALASPLTLIPPLPAMADPLLFVIDAAVRDTSPPIAELASPE